MFETIRIFQCNDRVLHPWVKHSIAVALLATLVSSPITAVWAEQVKNAEKAESDKPEVTITNDEIAKALAASPNVPQEAHSLATSFLDYTLPNLLADDEPLAQQLGLGDSVSNPILIDRALAIMLIRREDVMKLITEGAKPLTLVNNPNNWRKDNAGRLVPNRIIFSLQRDSSHPEAGPYTWSSVTLEQSREGSWRIIQVGAPKLSRAMRQYETREKDHFLLWIPDLNRHYLGEVKLAGDERDPKIILTTLFNDRFVRVKDEHGEHTRMAGEKFDVTSEEFIFHLERLYKELELPRKSRSQDGLVQQPPTQQKKLPGQSNEAQPPVQAR